MIRTLLVLAAAVLVAGCGSDDGDEAAAPQPVTVTQTVTETQTATTEPTVACSNAGVRLNLPEQDLPPAVADVRRRVFDAAIACDYDTLEQIALEEGEGFTFSYGGETDAAGYWRSLEEGSEEEPKPMRALAAILTMPYGRNESGSYTWPTAYSENPTAEAWQSLVDAGLYSQETVDQMLEQGTGYLGYRTAITADGDWQFFVAGD